MTYPVIRGLNAKPFSAESFLLTLRRSSPVWGKSTNAGLGDHQWLFRGQSDASWRMVPSAFRSDAFSNMPKGAHFPYAYLNSIKFEERDGTLVTDGQYFDAFRDNIVRELKALAAFHDYANDCGFDVPPFQRDFGVEPEIRGKNGRPANHWRVYQASSNWTNLVDLAAVAQHHGVPTRFLDATLHPWKACHFALAGWNPLKPTDISVWAIQKYNWIAVHRPTSQSNPRILAQDGILFQLEGADKYFLEHGRWREFPRSEEKPEQLSVASLDADVLRQHRLVQLVLDKSQVPELAQLLQTEGINETSLMVSLDGVAQSMKRQWELGSLF